MTSYSTTRADLRDAGASATEAVKDKVSRAADTVREGVRDGADRVQAEAAEAVETVRGRIAERPLTSLAIGVGIGLLAGFLFRRR